MANDDQNLNTTHSDQTPEDETTQQPTSQRGELTADIRQLADQLADQPAENADQENKIVSPENASEEKILEEAEETLETSNEQASPDEVGEQPVAEGAETTLADDALKADDISSQGRWYVVHTYAGHENKVLTNLKQRIESENLENKIFDILVPTQDKIEIRGGKKEQVKEKIFPGYILVKMILDDSSWLVVRTTQGVTSFVGMGNKPTPISETEVKSIIQFMTQGASPTFKDVFLVDDTVKIIDGPFAEFIGKVDSVDKEKGKVRILVSIFGRETPVELDFLQVQKL